MRTTTTTTKPTLQEAIHEALILWKELATNPGVYGPGGAKLSAVTLLVKQGLLPERALCYTHLCSFCEVYRDGDCYHCPWPGEQERMLRCERADCNGIPGIYWSWAISPSVVSAQPIFELMQTLADTHGLPSAPPAAPVATKDPEPTPSYGFKMGDRVKLVDMYAGPSCPENMFSDEPHNPKWGGKCGKVKGTVDRFYNDSPLAYPIGVQWDNGRHNSYAHRNLALLDPVADKVVVEPGQFYSHDGTVLLALYGDYPKNKYSVWTYFTDLAGNRVAFGYGPGDYTANPNAKDGGFTVYRDRLIPLGISLAQAHAAATAHNQDQED